MIHYTCDICHCEIDPARESRYIVKIEVHAAVEPLEVDESDDDRDYLAELHEVLESMDDLSDEELALEAGHQLRYDLCPECRKKFLKNPLGHERMPHLDFSQN